MDSKPSQWRAILVAIAWAAIPLSLLIWIILLLADSHWLGTLLAFGPRWALIVPVGMLAVPVAVWQRRGLVPLGLAAAVIVGPVMGLCVPWRRTLSKVQSPALEHEDTCHWVKVLTCNTLGGQAENQLRLLIEKEQPDVLVLQEWPSQRPASSLGIFPGMEEASQEAGTNNRDWHIARAGGILLASKWPIVASEGMESLAKKGHVIGLRCELEMGDGTVQFFGLHLLTPRNGLQAVLNEGLGGLDELKTITEQRQFDDMAVEAWINGYGGPKLVAGDLNLTPESAIYRRRFGHLQNAFSTAGWGYGGTKFTRIHSVRIDHVLADEGWQIARCEVCPDVGSDHRPVVAELTRLSNR